MKLMVDCYMTCSMACSMTCYESFRKSCANQAVFLGPVVGGTVADTAGPGDRQCDAYAADSLRWLDSGALGTAEWPLT